MITGNHLSLDESHETNCADFTSLLRCPSTASIHFYNELSLTHIYVRDSRVSVVAHYNWLAGAPVRPDCSSLGPCWPGQRADVGCFDSIAPRTAVRPFSIAQCGCG